MPCHPHASSEITNRTTCSTTTTEKHIACKLHISLPPALQPHSSPDVSSGVVIRPTISLRRSSPAPASLRYVDVYLYAQTHIILYSIWYMHQHSADDIDTSRRFGCGPVPHQHCMLLPMSQRPDGYGMSSCRCAHVYEVYAETVRERDRERGARRGTGSFE